MHGCAASIPRTPLAVESRRREAALRLACNSWILLALHHRKSCSFRCVCFDYDQQQMQLKMTSVEAQLQGVGNGYSASFAACRATLLKDRFHLRRGSRVSLHGAIRLQCSLTYLLGS